MGKPSARNTSSPSLENSCFCRLEAVTYICTFADCREKLRQFSSRASWSDHEFSEYSVRESWSCPECTEEYINSSDWEKHLQHAHDRAFSGPKFPVVKTTAYKRQARPVEEEECHLCCDKPRRGFIQHFGQHMEEIALTALPRQGDEDLDEAGPAEVRSRSYQANMVTLRTTSEDISEVGTKFQPPPSQPSSPKDVAPRLPSIDQPPNFLHHSPPAWLSEALSELR